jgi:hypothetical protein
MSNAFALLSTTLTVKLFERVVVPVPEPIASEVAAPPILSVVAVELKSDAVACE